MAQNQISKIACIAASMALSVMAQRGRFSPEPASVSIVASQNFVVAARSISLSGGVYNGRGALLRGRTITWQVSDSSRAVIDTKGTLLGVAPGAVDVTATDSESGVAATRTFVVYPDHVSISSDNSALQAGASRALSAQIVDAAGNAIPNIPVAWSTDLPAVASIDSNGMLKGVSAGRVTVTAALDMGPGLPRFTDFTNIEILRQAGFRLKDLVSTTAGPVSTLVPTRVSASGTAAAAISSLSNGGQGLLLWQNGQLQLIASSGLTLDSRVVTKFEGVSVNSHADVFTIADTQSEGCNQLLLLFTAASHWTPTVLADTNQCSYSAPTPAALSDSGAIVYRYGPSAILRNPDGTLQTLLSAGDKPAGIGTISGVTNWGFSRFGTLLIEANNSLFQPVYFTWDGTKLNKLFGSGDMIENNPIQWARLPTESRPGVFLTRTGGSNWSSIAQLSSGSWTVIARSGRNNVGWVQDNFDGTGSDTYFWADYSSNGQGGTALLHNDGTANTVLGLYTNWRDASFVRVLANGGVFAYGTFNNPVPRALIFNANTSITVFATGLTVDRAGAPAVGQASVPKGVNASGPILRTWGDTLLKAIPSGVTTLLKPGDSLPVGNLTSLGSFATNRLGDAAFVAQHGNKLALYSYVNGQFNMVIDTDAPVEGATVNSIANSDTQIAMNNRGHIVAHLYTSGGEVIYLFTAGATSATPVFRINGIAPGTTASFNNLGQVAIDENDRVAFTSSLSSGKQGLFIWDQGNLREILESGQTDSTGRIYGGFSNVQAGGSRFFARAAVTGLNEHLVIDGTTPKLLVSEGYVTSFGAVVTGLIGTEMAVNTRGDLAIPVVTPSGPALLVKKSDGTDALAAIASEKGPDQEWFLQIYGSGISEQGDLVFSALISTGGSLRLAVYQAAQSSN